MVFADLQAIHATTARVLGIFKPIQRHLLVTGDACEPQSLVTDLAPLQRQVITLLGPSPADYGR